MFTPSKYNFLELECTCANITEQEHERLYHNATRADKDFINRAVKRHLPELYKQLSPHLRNPYSYYKTATHLILVHSATDYFIRYKRKCN